MQNPYKAKLATLAASFVAVGSTACVPKEGVPPPPVNPIPPKEITTIEKEKPAEKVEPPIVSVNPLPPLPVTNKTQ